MAEFVRGKIRQTVKDPVAAEALCPKDAPDRHQAYSASIQRLLPDLSTATMSTLVDISQTPIERLTEAGLSRRLTTPDFEFDAIVFATGFDAMTGTLFNVDIRGRNGLELKKKWEAGPAHLSGL